MFFTLVWKNMAVITRWSYKRGGRKAGFHCKPWGTVWDSLRSLEVVGTRKNGRARRRRACPFSLSPTSYKRLLRRLSMRKLPTHFKKEKIETTTSFPGFSPNRYYGARWVVTWLQNKIKYEGGVLCLSIFCPFHFYRLRNNQKSKIDLLTLTTMTETWEISA